MCTVTYIPQENNQFILTSNRDESPERSSQHIARQSKNNIDLIFPRDKTAGGTWIAVANTDRVVCLLNGAFEKHKHRPPYRKSRGIMVLEFFDYPTANAFFKEYDFKGMEPFTMVILENEQLFEFRWDEKKVHITELDRSHPHIWSSSTLYNDEIKKKRKEWFAKWQLQNEFKLEQIFNFHKNAGEGNSDYDLVMNRNNIVQTVSITNIIKNSHSIELQYHDLIHSTFQQKEINLQREFLESYQK